MNQHNKNLPPVSWSITMDTPKFEAATGAIKTIFRIKTTRGRDTWTGGQIKDIFIDNENYRDLANVIGAMETQGESGEYSFACELNPEYISVDIVVITGDDKEIRRSFPIPEIKPPQTPKPGWIQVAVGNPYQNKKTKGRIIIKTAKDGKITTGDIYVSSDRPFVIMENSITGSPTEKDRWDLTITNGEMLFEIQMSTDPNHKQQQIFFVLQETGQEVKILLAIM